MKKIITKSGLIKKAGGLDQLRQAQTALNQALSLLQGATTPQGKQWAASIGQIVQQMIPVIDKANNVEYTQNQMASQKAQQPGFNARPKV